MITEINATQFQQNSFEILNQVQNARHQFLIKHNGKPMAALVDPVLLARIQRMQERFDDACQQIAQAFADIPEEQGMEEIDRAVRELRKSGGN